MPSRALEAVPVEPGDAVVVATSASTGAPKGVVLTHEAVAASARATSARLEVDPATHRWLACLPLNHIGGLSVVTRALLTGTPLTILDGFDAGQVSAESGDNVLVSLVPTALARVQATVVLQGRAGRVGATLVVASERGDDVRHDGDRERSRL